MRLSFIVALVFLAGCAAPERLDALPGSRSTAAIDFTPYTAQGFLFTPESYAGEYESVGMMLTTVWAAGQRGPDRVRDLGSEGRTQRTPGDWEFEEVSADDALSELHRRAVEMGADALTQIDIQRVERSFNTGTLEVTTQEGVEVSGFAIRRL